MSDIDEIRFCTSLLSSVNSFFTGTGIKLDSVLIGQLLSIYKENENDDFRSVFSFIEGITDCKFISLSINNIIKSDEKFLIYNNDHWFVGTSENIGDEHFVFRAIMSSNNKNCSLGELINIWSVNKSGLAVYIFYSAFLSILALSIPLYMNAVYGRIIPSSAEASLWTLSILTIIFFVCEIYLKKKRESIVSKFMSDFSVFFETRYIRKLVSFSSSKTNRWGKDRNEAILNFSKLRTLFWIFFSTNYIDSVFVFVYLFVIAIVGKWLVIASVCVIVLQLLVIFYYDRKLKLSNVEAVSDTFNPQLALIENYKASSDEDAFVNHCASLAAKTNLIQGIKLDNKISSSALFSFISSLQIIMTVIFAYYLLQDNDISSGALFATIILSGKLNQSIAPLASLLPLTRRLRSSFSQIESSFNSATPSVPVEDDSNLRREVWKVENLHLAYDDGVELFSNLNFKITSGEKVAIVGMERSGKSSLYSLLLGLLTPTSGKLWRHVLKNGKSNVCFSPLKTYSYTDTLYNYLSMNGTAKEDEIKNVLNLPFLRWLPSVFPSGIHSPIGEKFSVLRSDRLQMLEIARMLLSNKEIFIMDEPTSYVSSEVELLFCERFNQKISDESTVVIFTNRMRLLGFVDRVIVIENGKIAFDGLSKDFVHKEIYQV